MPPIEARSCLYRFAVLGILAYRNQLRLKKCPLIRHLLADQSHDSFVFCNTFLMAVSKSTRIITTPHGASIDRIAEGKFLVCDQEKSCHFVDSLYRAEEFLSFMEIGYQFPYSTNFRSASYKDFV